MLTSPSSPNAMASAGDLATLKDGDAFQIRTSGGDLLITGRSDRAGSS